MSRNFDLLTYPSRLKPYNSSESGNDTSAREIAKFLTANSNLYGLGVVSGTSRVKIFTKNGYTDGSWSEPGNAEAASLARNTSLFVWYNSAIYGAHGTGGTGQIYKCTFSGAFADTHHTLNFTSIGQGVVHSKDDILYVPYDNKIAKNNADSWTDAALTLPTDYVAHVVAEYGSFLAIGAIPSTSAGRPHSRVFLWDRDSSLATVTESIEWGPGNLEVLTEYEGALIGIGYLGQRLLVKEYRGFQGFVKVHELMSEAVTTIFPSTPQFQKHNDRIYFQAQLTIGGSTHNGVWSLGRNSEGLYSLSFDRSANNDTEPNSMQSFIYHDDSTEGQQVFVAYTDGNADEQVSMTNNVETTFSATSIYETTKFDCKSPSNTKTFIGATVTFAPLASAGQVVLKYKKDADSSWSSAILTVTTDSALRGEVNNMAAQINDFKELQFRIESTGGAEITSFSFDAVPKKDKSYG
jgi:hypothetical protein